MPTTLIVDPSKIDKRSVFLTREQVMEYLEQRFEMLMIDRVLEADKDENYVVGLNRVGEKEFWAEGHIPGRPIMPGVLVIETAAQMASIHVKIMDGRLRNKFIGFAGVNHVKFRKQVLPGQDLYMVTRIVKMRSRSFTVSAQGFVDDTLVFEGEIVGIAL